MLQCLWYFTDDCSASRAEMSVTVRPNFRVLFDITFAMWHMTVPLGPRSIHPPVNIFDIYTSLYSFPNSRNLAGITEYNSLPSGDVSCLLNVSTKIYTSKRMISVQVSVCYPVFM